MINRGKKQMQKSEDFCRLHSLAQGYKEMSRINLELAEETVSSDNEALELCEQKFAECE